MSCLSLLSKVPDNLRIFFVVLFGINCVASSLLNISVLLLFAKRKYLRNMSDLYLLSLSIGDLIVGIVLSPSIAMQISKYNSWNCLADKLRRSFFTLLSISALTVVMIAYDRYIHIRKLESYSSSMTKHKFIFLIMLSWFVPFLIIGVMEISQQVGNLFLVALFVTIYVTLIYSYIKLVLIL